MAIAPFNSIEASVSLIDAAAAADPANLVGYRTQQQLFVGMMATALAKQQASFQPSQVMGADLLALMSQYKSQCIFKLLGIVGQDVATKTPAAYQGFSAQWAANTSMKAFLQSNDSAVASGFRVAKPTLVLQGTADPARPMIERAPQRHELAAPAGVAPDRIAVQTSDMDEFVSLICRLFGHHRVLSFGGPRPMARVLAQRCGTLVAGQLEYGVDMSVDVDEVRPGWGITHALGTDGATDSQRFVSGDLMMYAPGWCGRIDMTRDTQMRNTFVPRSTMDDAVHSLLGETPDRPVVFTSRTTPNSAQAERLRRIVELMYTADGGSHAFTAALQHSWQHMFAMELLSVWPHTLLRHRERSALVPCAASVGVRAGTRLRAAHGRVADALLPRSAARRREARTLQRRQSAACGRRGTEVGFLEPRAVREGVPGAIRRVAEQVAEWGWAEWRALHGCCSEPSGTRSGLSSGSAAWQRWPDKLT